MSSVTGTISENSFKDLFKDFKELTKARLALSVVFSAIAGYLLGTENIDIISVGLLAIGGYNMVGASNVYNQIIERNLDRLMNRTRNRPIPAGRVNVTFALVLAVVMTIVGAICLYELNLKTAIFGLLSIFLYTCVYTPLKTKTPLSVFAGAFPGAIPFMLGWVAASGTFGIEPGTLFMIQFFWQFPHFWALAWMLDEDYTRGGFKMLPTGKKDTGTVVLIIMYTIWMLVVSIIPAFGITGDLKLSVFAATLVFLMGLFMLWNALRLYERRDFKSARNLMLSSVSYITLMQVVYVLDKFISN
jgi:protoheme IX farnesyltransferase